MISEFPRERDLESFLVIFSRALVNLEVDVAQTTCVQIRICESHKERNHHTVSPAAERRHLDRRH
jgi:hypothetical protein